jgi:type I restriction enzyme S subunit
MTRDKLAIGDFCRTGSGGTPSRKKASRYFGGSIPWVKSGELREGVITKTEETITEHAVIESSAKLIPKGALLVAMYGATIGRVANLGIEATSNQAVCHILPDESLADTQYMFHALQAQVPHWLGRGVGGAQPNISQEIIKNTVIPLPPLEEQRRIAAILDKVRLIQDRAEARTEALRSFEESLFNHLFGGAHEQRSRWEWEQFGSLCSRLTVGVVVKPASYYCETGVPALRSLNVKPGQVVETNLVYISEEHNDGILAKSRLSCGDLVFVRSGRPGTCAVIPPSLDGCNAIDLLLATTDSTRILPGFASSYFNSEGGKASIFAESRGQVQQHFNAGSLASALVPVPPIEIQEEFCNTLKARNAQLTKCEFSIESLNALSKALENSLMSGNHQ